MNGIVAQQRKIAAVGKITPESFTGFRPIMVYFAGVFIVSFLQKNASFVVGMNHIDPPFFLRLLDGSLHPHFPDLFKAYIDTNMSSHLFDKFNLIGLEQNFAILLAASSALTALIKNGIQCTCT
jgi:hypothetical protein